MLFHEHIQNSLPNLLQYALIHNLTSQEKSTLKILDSKIVIKPFEKGSGICLMDTFMDSSKN